MGAKRKVIQVAALETPCSSGNVASAVALTNDGKLFSLRISEVDQDGKLVDVYQWRELPDVPQD